MTARIAIAFDNNIVRWLQIVPSAVFNRNKCPPSRVISVTWVWRAMCLRLSFLPSLGEINFPLFVERTVETSKDDITGCVQLRCDRGHNSLGLKQDHAGQGRGVRGSGYTKVVISNREPLYSLQRRILKALGDITYAIGGLHYTQRANPGGRPCADDGGERREKGLRDITTLRDDEDCS